MTSRAVCGFVGERGRGVSIVCVGIWCMVHWGVKVSLGMPVSLPGDWVSMAFGASGALWRGGRCLALCVDWRR